MTKHKKEMEETRWEILQHYLINLSDFALFHGIRKIFLNMTSKNGSKELVSMLQFR